MKNMFYQKARTILFGMAMILSSAAIVNAQPWLSPQASGGSYFNTLMTSVFFTSPTQGWAVGNNGTILATSNGGANWAKQTYNPGATVSLNSVHFISANQGWAVGSSGNIHTTSNGGTSWAPQTSGIPSIALNSVYFTSATKGWAVGAAGNIRVFNGTNWASQSSGTSAILYSVFFTSDTKGWAVGAAGTLCTFNGTSSWTSKSISSSVLNSVFFTSDTKGWAVGAGGNILVTSNGGDTWTSQSSSGSTLNSVFFTSDTKGWAVGNSGTILTTSNGGSTWTSQASGTTENLRSVKFTSATQGWVVGNAGTILTTSDGGATWSTQTFGTSQNLYSVHFPSPSIGWAVGNTGTIVTSSNGGVSWAPQTSNTTNQLNSVYFTSVTQGWAVGNSGTILNTVNSGTTWSAQTSGTTANLRSVYFLSATQGWAVGNNGTIRTTSNGGATWSAQTSPTSNQLNSVYFITATKGCAAGANGTILVTNNGGATWTTQTSGTANSLSSVYFTTPTKGTAVGATGTILKTVDGGTTWTAQTSGTTNQLNSTHFSSTTHGMVAGSGGHIRATSNSSTSWPQETSTTSSPLNSIFFSSATKGWAVGDAGTILIYTNTCTNPTAFSMTGGGSYCAGATGVPVGLSNSEAGTTYQLKVNGDEIGSLVSGTGSAISFGNQTVSGTYTVLATRTIVGCTSTMIGSADVLITQPSTSTTTHTACGSYTWNGTNYTTSGAKTFVTLNAAGCDSTATLNLTINQPSTSTTNHSACGSYTWNGINYTTSGAKTFVTINAAGCDSTATLNLTITNKPSTPTISAGGATTFCTGGSVELTSSSAIGNSWSTGETSQTITTSASGTYKVAVTNAGCTSDSSAGISVTVNTCSSTSTWNGTSWSNGVPTSTTDIIISGSYNTASNGSLSVRDIVINSDAFLNISIGSVAGRNITIKNNGSLIHTSSNLTITGTSTVERIGTNNGNTYNYWSSPVAVGVLPGAAKYTYVESARTATDYQTGWKSWGTAMALGKGYAATGGGTTSFVGSLNSGTVLVPMTLSNIGSAIDNGWNLLGNPYPSEINLTSFFASNSVTGSAVYLWNGTNYITLNSGAIPSCQGFFVQSTGAPTAFFSNEMRINGSQGLFRTEEESAKVILKIEGSGYVDQTQVELRKEATDGYDQTFDAYKLKGNADLQLYSKIANTGFNYAINILADGTKEIPLSYDAKKAGTYSIYLDKLAGLPIDASVTLIDKVRGTKHDLLKGAYVFQGGEVKEEQRFKLIMGSPLITSLDESKSNEEAVIYANSNIVYAAKAGAFELALYTVNGVMIYKTNAVDKVSIPVEQSGIYIAKLTSANTTSTAKVMIAK